MHGSIVNRIHFLISFLDFSLSLYDSCVLVLYPATLLNSFKVFNTVQSGTFHFLHIKPCHPRLVIIMFLPFQFQCLHHYFFQRFFLPNPLSLLQEVETFSHWPTSPVCSVFFGFSLFPLCFSDWVVSITWLTEITSSSFCSLHVAVELHSAYFSIVLISLSISTWVFKFLMFSTSVLRLFIFFHLF